MGSTLSKVSVDSLGILRDNNANCSNLQLSELQLLEALRRIILMDDILDHVVDGSRKSIKRKRAQHNRKTDDDLWQTVWGKSVTAIRNELFFNGGVESNTKLQVKFRNRFRLPFSMFEDIVVECKLANIFGRTQIGVEFKLLGCLRILGRGNVSDDIVEILGIGDTTVNEMFKTFLRNYSDAYFDTYVYVPDGEEMDKVVEDYSKMGFPGCVGSMDVTHILWHKCPSRLRHVCTGRYHCPSVAFQIVCSHTRRIHHVSNPFYGATNDITITYNDTYPRDIMLSKIHQDRKFTTYNREGGLTYWRGAYVICDGGYPKCFCFIDTTLTDYDYHAVIWSEWLESIRKDSERVFHAIKFRFRWLLHSVQYHSIETIGLAVKVASILHNRLLKYDKFDTFNWESMDPTEESDVDEEVNVQENIACNEIVVEDLPLPNDLSMNNENEVLEPVGVQVQLTQDIEDTQMDSVQQVEEVHNPVAEQQQWVIKEALKKHLSFAYSNGQIQWPRRFTNLQKQKMPLLMVSFATNIFMEIFFMEISIYFFP